VLIVGVVKAVDVGVLTVDTDAVVPVVITGVLAVVCDSVVNVVGVVVVSVTPSHTQASSAQSQWCKIYSETTIKMNIWHTS